MRPRGGKATLGELLGGSTQELSLSNVQDVLGEKMPTLPKNKVGRYRLMMALRNRFGNGYRNIPGVKDVMSEFDEEIQYQKLHKKLSDIKVKKEK